MRQVVSVQPVSEGEVSYMVQEECGSLFAMFVPRVKYGGVFVWSV